MMFYLATIQLRTNSCRITNKNRKQKALDLFPKNEIHTLNTSLFEISQRENTKIGFSTKVDFANGQTHKKTGKDQRDLRFLQLLSSELLQDQHENQT